MKPALLLFTLSCGLGAQSTAQIQGSIQDATGAAIPAAVIKATQTQTGAVRNTTTGVDGAYVLTNLPIGPYRLEISKPGSDRHRAAGGEPADYRCLAQSKRRE